MGNSLKGKRIFSGTSDVGLGGSGGVSPVYTDLDPVISQTNTPQPDVAGDRYLVGTAPTGAWVGKNNQIAEGTGAGFTYTAPTLDDYVYITSTLVTLKYNGTAWIAAPARAILQNGNNFGPSGPMRIGNINNGVLYLVTNNAIRLRIDGASADIRTTGSLKVGDIVTTATARLHVKGADTLATSYALKIEDSAALPLLSIQNDGWTGVGVLLPQKKFHVKTTGILTPFRIENGTYTLDFSPEGTSTLAELVSSNTGFQFSSTEAYFRMNRTTAGTALIYVNGSATSLTLSGATSGVEHLKLSSTGALSLTGPAITAGAAVASTNRVAINVNGTTYYFLVTTVA